ncbi:MAG: 4Fe-4S ferredoxin, partial [Oscillospiraceae bacterium]|nr:4Fe-4S ferredoxin [Oscillospiraceae bacterium]
MNTTRLIVAYFSPTGGTKKVVDAIVAGFDMPAVEVDLTKDNSSVAIDEVDILLAVLPVYAGRVPQVALKRLSAMRGNGQKALAVVVYGNREYDDALLETKNAL